MALDVIDAHRLGDSGLLIKIEHVTMEVRVIENATKVTFEVTVVNDVEPNEGAEEAPVGFNDSIAKQVTTACQSPFHFVQSVEQSFACSFVRLLPSREACAINAVVDILVEKIGELGLLRRYVRWEKIDILVLGELVEDAVEHRTDVVFAIVDDSLRLLVPQDWNSYPAVEFWISRFVGFAQIPKAVDRISRFEVIELL